MIYRLRSYHGGLGDELQFSCMAEYMTELGHEVYLLDDNSQVLPIRNEGIKKLCYDYNPYINGSLKGEWNLGDIPGTKYENLTGNFIMNWEKILGFEPKNTLPKIYYQPNYLEEYSDKIIVTEPLALLALWIAATLLVRGWRMRKGSAEDERAPGGD